MLKYECFGLCQFSSSSRCNCLFYSFIIWGSGMGQQKKTEKFHLWEFVDFEDPIYFWRQMAQKLLDNSPLKKSYFKGRGPVFFNIINLKIVPLSFPPSFQKNISNMGYSTDTEWYGNNSKRYLRDEFLYSFSKNDFFSATVIKCWLSCSVNSYPANVCLIPVKVKYDGFKCWWNIALEFSIARTFHTSQIHYSKIGFWKKSLIWWHNYLPYGFVMYQLMIGINHDHWKEKRIYFNLSWEVSCHKNVCQAKKKKNDYEIKSLFNHLIASKFFFIASVCMKDSCVFENLIPSVN